MSKQRQCYSCDAEFWLRHDTLTVGVQHPLGSSNRNGHASFCPACTERLYAAVDEQAASATCRTPLHQMVWEGH